MIKEFGKKFAIGVFATAMLLVSGCSTLKEGANSTRDWLADPQTKAAFQTLQVGTQVFVCNIANMANLASQIEAAVNAHQAVKTTTGQVATVSSIVCNALTGIATPAVVTAVSTAPSGAPVVAVK